MRTVQQKEKVYGYLFKAVLSLILLFCLYNVACILLISPYNSGGKARTRASRVIDTVESNIKLAGPPKKENIIYKSYLENKTNDSFWVNQIKRTTVFAKPVEVTAEIRVEETEEEVVQYVKVEEVDNTKIIFKGIVDGLAYIGVRKEIDGQWREHGFPTKVGEKIGNKKNVGGKMLDFTTNYVLQDVVYNAQRLVTLDKKIVSLNEAGEFVGTRIVPGETYMKSTAMITCEDENGNTKELWMSGTVNTNSVE